MITRKPVLMFEKQPALYILKQAEMPFFMISSYPHFTFKDGSVVEDRSDSAKALQDRANTIYRLFQKIADRVKRGKIVPKTWVKPVEEARTLVQAALQCRNITAEWAEQYERALRFLNSYTPTDTITEPALHAS